MADLQRQLQTAKKEAKDIQESFDRFEMFLWMYVSLTLYVRYKDEMQDLGEAVEIATLDKEMAEEKAESVQHELDALKEKFEEVNLDLQIMREEVITVIL